MNRYCHVKNTRIFRREKDKAVSLGFPSDMEDAPDPISYIGIVNIGLFHTATLILKQEITFLSHYADERDPESCCFLLYRILCSCKQSKTLNRNSVCSNKNKQV